MGIVRNPANTMRRGRIGETTYYISGGQQIARQALNSSNFGETARRSSAQQRRRVLWANLVNFYKASAGWMPKAFETKKRNQSDYNKFMQLNINTARIALTKDEAAAGSLIIDAFLVSQGSLPSISISKSVESWRTNISVGGLTIGPDTTVAEFSEAVIRANENVREGMQLSFVSYQQSRDVLNIYRSTCRLYEVTIDTKNENDLENYLPDFCAKNVEGFLGTSANISVGGFTYILSEESTSGIKVSTQQLVSTNDALIRQYSSADQLDKAVLSYGLDKEVVLSPVSLNSQSPEDQPMYISYVLFNGHQYKLGEYLGTFSQLAGKTVTVAFNNKIGDDTVQGVHLIGANGNNLVDDSYNQFDDNIGVTFEATPSTSEVVSALVVDFPSHSISISFDSSETGGDL